MKGLWRQECTLQRERVINKCQYVDVCYLAESLQCYGYKLDCVLYTKSNGGAVTREDFHRAINELIDQTKARHLDITEKIRTEHTGS